MEYWFWTKRHAALAISAGRKDVAARILPGLRTTVSRMNETYGANSYFAAKSTVVLARTLLFLEQKEEAARLFPSVRNAQESGLKFDYAKLISEVEEGLAELALLDEDIPSYSRHLENAIAILARAFGPEHPVVAKVVEAQSSVLRAHQMPYDENRAAHARKILDKIRLPLADVTTILQAY